MSGNSCQVHTRFGLGPLAGSKELLHAVASVMLAHPPCDSFTVAPRQAVLFQSRGISDHQICIVDDRLGSCARLVKRAVEVRVTGRSHLARKRQRHYCPRLAPSAISESKRRRADNKALLAKVCENLRGGTLSGAAASSQPASAAAPA